MPDQKNYSADQRRRIKEYGAITLDTPPDQFKTPFLHLNFLSEVIRSDSVAIMSVQGEPQIAPDIFHVMTILWNSIEGRTEGYHYDIFAALKEFGEIIIDDVRRLRHNLARIEARVRYITQHSGMSPMPKSYISEIPTIMERDYTFILRRDQEYHASWLKRGGVGAFMMLARKWDRFSPMVIEFNNDPVDMLLARPDRVDDVQDLRRYLALVNAEWNRRTLLARSGPV